MKLSANNISIKYNINDKIIIDNQSIKIQEGKINVFLGPNGCRKIYFI